MMKIENHKLVSDAQEEQIPFMESPNQSGVFAAGLPDTIVIHYTGGSSLDSSVDWLRRPAAQASAHLVVGKTGKIVQLVSFNKIAWHAGRSKWKNRTGLNKYSIGIEIDNAGLLEKRADGTYYTSFGRIINDNKVVLAPHKNDSALGAWEAYTDKQMDAVADICSMLMEQYPITEIVGHDDISPGRKIDPGPAYPMKELRDTILIGRKEEETDERMEESTSGQKAIVKADYLNIRARPSGNAVTISEPLPKGTAVKIQKSEGEWAYVKVDLEGWVSRKYLKTS